MGKIRNMFYPNPAKSKNHEVGSKIMAVQPVKVLGKKFVTPTIFFPYNFYINISSKAEYDASLLLEEILRWVDNQKSDPPVVDKEKNNRFIANAMNSVVWGYSALEAYSNSVISNLSQEKKKERFLRMTLGAKLKNILPKLTKKSQVKNNIWNKFNEVDTIRHKLIHTDLKYWETLEWKDSVVFEFYNGKFKGVSKMVQAIIEHFNEEVLGGSSITTIKIAKRGLQSDSL